MATMYQSGKELVERSACCRADVLEGTKPSRSWLDPDEPVDVCAACGQICDVDQFIRDDADGSLTDPVSGTVYEESTGRVLEAFAGPDEDALFEERRELRREQEGRS